MPSFGRLLAPLGLLGAFACTIGSPTHSTYNEAPHRADAGAATPKAAASQGDAGRAQAAASVGSKDADCCKQSDGTGFGKCVSDQQIPEGDRDHAEQLECAAADKCVPLALSTDQPVTCEIALMDGICMNKCFSSYLSYTAGLLASEDCGPDDACIPCRVLPDITPGCKP